LGDDAILDSVTMAELPTLPPAEIDVALEPERGWLGTRFLDGTFESPEHRLPPPVRRARFRLLLPQGEPTGASLSFPVALVPMAAAATPGTLFCDGLLALHVDWSGFQRRGRRRGGTRDALYRYLCRFDVTLLPRPPAPEAAIVVATEQDGVIAPSDMRAIAAHWRSPELRWVRAGHMSTLFLHQRVLRRAIADAFERLAATPPPAAPVDRAGRGCGCGGGLATPA
jgi:hypothetical protein